MLAAGISSVSKLKGSSISRIRLKHDLEILHLLEKDNLQYNLVRNHVEEAVESIYDVNEDERKVRSWSGLIWGVVAMVVGSCWAIYLTRDVSHGGLCRPSSSPWRGSSAPEVLRLEGDD